MKKLLQFVLVVGGLAAMNSCGNGAAGQAGPGGETLQVEAYKVVAQQFNNELKTTANLLANEQVQLMAPMAGQVLAIYFKEGQTVNKGQVLVRLDDRSWKAQLLGVQAELDVAQKDLKRKIDLLSIEGSSQEEIDIAFSKVEILKSQLQQLQVNIDLANVSAPFSGQLGMRDFSEGAFLNQGALLTTLSSNQELKVDFTIAQMHSNSVKINKPINVVIGTDTLEAIVYAINPLINMDTRMLNVRAKLPTNKNGTIKPGTFAEVLIATEMINDAILIPTQAVVPSINDQTVYVAKNGVAVRKVIQMGTRNADNVLVLEGLAIGDTVITTGLLQIKEGMKLNIQAVK